MVQGFGGDWMDTTTNAMELDSPEATANGLVERSDQRRHQPLRRDKLRRGGVASGLQGGDAALMRNWPYAWAELQKDDSAVKGVGISLMVAQPGERPGATLGSWTEPDAPIAAPGSSC